MSTPAGPLFVFGALLDHSLRHKGLGDVYLKIPTRSFSSYKAHVTVEEQKSLPSQLLSNAFGWGI